MKLPGKEVRQTLQKIVRNSPLSLSRKRLLFAGILLSVIFITYRILLLSRPDAAASMSAFFQMPAQGPMLLVKPWTPLVSFVFHSSFWTFLFTLLGFMVFGNLSSRLFFSEDRMTLALFLAGGVLSNVVFLILTTLPMLRHTLHSMEIGGAGAAVMTLMTVSASFYPRYTMRVFGIWALQLNTLTQIVIGISVAGILFHWNTGLNLQIISGALTGFLLVWGLKRLTPLKRQLWTDRSEQIVFMKREKIIFTPTRRKEKPLSDEEFNEIKKRKADYLDDILDKINQKGMKSLTKEELEYLKRYGKN
jgi:hypothetical protein